MISLHLNDTLHIVVQRFEVQLLNLMKFQERYMQRRYLTVVSTVLKL